MDYRHAFLAVKWRWVLSSVHLALYLILINTGRDLPSEYLAVDPATLLSRRIALSINTPAAVVSSTTANMLDRGQELSDFLTGLMLLPQWSLIGFWIDLRLQDRSVRSQFKGSTTSVIAVLMAVVLAATCSAWLTILSEPRLLAAQTIEVVGGAIIWPSFLIWILGTTLWQRLRLRLEH